MTTRTLTQEQSDRYDAFEAMLDMMEPGVAYTKEEIQATLEQVIEMAIEDREAEALPVQETYLDRYPDQRTSEFTNDQLLREADRLENKADFNTDSLDRLDSIRYNFVKTELRYRANIGIL